MSGYANQQPYGGGFSQYSQYPQYNNRPQYNGPYANQQPYNGPRQVKKKSGCSMIEKAKNGLPCVYGWRIVRGQGRYSFVSSPAKKPGKSGGGPTGRWVKFVTTVTRPDGSEFFINTVWDNTRKRLKFLKGGQVANPHAPNGGYWGRGGYKVKIRDNQQQYNR